jgi:hypothetical protein
MLVDGELGPPSVFRVGRGHSVHAPVGLTEASILCFFLFQPPPQKGPLLKSKGTTRFNRGWKEASTPRRIRTLREPVRSVR